MNRRHRSIRRRPARFALKFATFAAGGGTGGVLWTSHNMYEVEEVCDRVLFLSHGQDSFHRATRRLCPREYGKVIVSRNSSWEWSRERSWNKCRFNTDMLAVARLRQFYLLRGEAPVAYLAALRMGNG